MRLRVVECDDESHDLGWVLASECSHWPRTCPRAKKAKKAHHDFIQSRRGYAVLTDGISGDGDTLTDLVMGDITWAEIVKRQPGVVDLVEKWYEGKWVRGKGDEQQPFGSYFLPASPGKLVGCSRCGFKASIG